MVGGQIFLKPKKASARRRREAVIARRLCQIVHRTRKAFHIPETPFTILIKGHFFWLISRLVDGGRRSGGIIGIKQIVLWIVFRNSLFKATNDGVVIGRLLREGLADRRRVPG